MQFLSVTNKKTQLHKSPADHSVVVAYEHDQKAPISTDISLFHTENVPNSFIQIYKTKIVEVFRVKKTEDGSSQFIKMRKIKHGEIQAVAGGKARFEFAVGCLTGENILFDFKSGKTVVKFPAGPNKASVVSLDLNADNSYLASAYEDGLINIFSLEKKVKSSELKTDDALFVRFHPTRRNHLALSKHKGHVSIYDFTSNKTVFLDKSAHDAPCREVTIPDDNPDRLFTCGYDSIIKIFDMRKKSTGLQIQSYCGFSTISTTKCGGFFAVGNLKGDLLTYDLRDLKKPLAMTKGDGDLITRVAFMPKFDPGESFEATTVQVSDELPDPPEDQEDLLDHILEMNKGRPSDFDLNCSSRVSAISSKVNEDRRGSALFGQNLANVLNLSLNIDGSLSSSSHSPAPDTNRNSKKDSLMKRRSSFLPSPMQLIQEEQSDKENQLNSPNMSAPRGSSTPTVRFNLKDKIKSTTEDPESSEEVIDVDALDSFKKNMDQNPQNHTTADFSKEFEGIREAIRFEIQSLNFDLSGRHIETMTYIFNQRRQLEKRLERIEECMGLLMNDDAKIARVMDLMDENTSLKNQLANVMGQLNATRQVKEE